MDNNPIDVKNFLSTKKALIIDSSKAFRDAIRQALVDMGIPNTSIFSGFDFYRGESILLEKKPEIIFSEFEIKNVYALDFLVPKHVKNYPDQLNRIYIIATSNKTDTAVAEAAEGEIDGYVLKPFPVGSLKDYFQKIILSKMKPSEYQILLRKGQNFLEEKKFDKAVDIFVQASQKDKSPSLAYYYAGIARLNLDQFDQALVFFEKGLSLNPIHYRCLSGQLDVFIRTKNNDKAFQVIQVFAKNFPMTAQRLKQMFILAIYTHNFHNVEEILDFYFKLDRRPEDLKKVVVASCMAAGKLFLKDKEVARAMNLFEKGSNISGRDAKFIETVIQALLNFELVSPAQLFLKIYPLELQKSDSYVRLDFAVQSMILEPEKLVQLGRKLISDGIATKEIYKLVLDHLLVLKKYVLAESIAIRGMKELCDDELFFRDYLKVIDKKRVNE